MDQAALQRGNCNTCGQRRVLGSWLSKDASESVFRCCACLDEHGDNLDDKIEPADASATNWWACAEPPQDLQEVPEGLLAATPWHDTYGRQFLTVCDPEHCYFSGLGAERVWGAGKALAEYLSTWQPAGLQVVELGAGCGLPGIVLAKGGAFVTLTDVPWLLQMLEYNVAANFSPYDPLRPYVSPLRWGNDADAASVLQVIGRPPDLLIGADLVYREQDFDALLTSIETLAPRRALLAVQRRDVALEAFIKRVRFLGWSVFSQTIAPKVFLLEVQPPVHLKNAERARFNFQEAPEQRCQAAPAA